MASGLFDKKEATGVWWRDHSLSIVIGLILLAQTIYALYSGSYVFAREQPMGAAVGAWSRDSGSGSAGSTWSRSWPTPTECC